MPRPARYHRFAEHQRLRGVATPSHAAPRLSPPTALQDPVPYRLPSPQPSPRHCVSLKVATLARNAARSISAQAVAGSMPATAVGTAVAGHRASRAARDVPGLADGACQLLRSSTPGCSAAAPPEPKPRAGRPAGHHTGRQQGAQTPPSTSPEPACAVQAGPGTATAPARQWAQRPVASHPSTDRGTRLLNAAVTARTGSCSTRCGHAPGAWPTHPHGGSAASRQEWVSADI